MSLLALLQAHAVCIHPTKVRKLSTAVPLLCEPSALRPVFECMDRFVFKIAPQERPSRERDQQPPNTDGSAAFHSHNATDFVRAHLASHGILTKTMWKRPLRDHPHIHKLRSVSEQLSMCRNPACPQASFLWATLLGEHTPCGKTIPVIRPQSPGRRGGWMRGELLYRLHATS